MKWKSQLLFLQRWLNIQLSVPSQSVHDQSEGFHLAGANGALKEESMVGQ